MSIRRFQLKFLCIGVLAAFAVNPTAIKAQYYTETKCLDLYEQQSRLFRARSFKEVIRVARHRLTYCREWMATREDYALTLEFLAAALTADNQYGEALAVADRCVQVDPSSLGCRYERASSLHALGRIVEARNTLERALALPAITEGDAKMKPLLQNFLSRLPNSPPAAQPQRKTGDRYGTGFYVSATGYLVTNHHVGGSCTSVQTSDGTKLTLIGSDKSTDLALLQAVGKTPKASASFRQSDALVGEPAIVFGFPLPGILSTSGNLTTGIVSASSGIRNDPHTIQISAPVQPGNSGGPLLDQYGNVIGVVVAKLDAGRIAQIVGDIPENVNFAIKGSEVIAFLARHKITASAGATVRVPNEALAAAASSFTVQIVCQAPL
jgi:S1-C subfamily serine protease